MIISDKITVAKIVLPPEAIRLAEARTRKLNEAWDAFRAMHRGPGEFLGARQSGVPMLRFADLEEDMVLLEKARDWAPKLIAERPDVVEAHLNRWLGSREQYLGV